MIQICNGKMKTKWEGQFFSKKNLIIQFDKVLNSESKINYFKKFDQILTLKKIARFLKRLIFIDFVAQISAHINVAM